jgi:hypothetical protein
MHVKLQATIRFVEVASPEGGEGTAGETAIIYQPPQASDCVERGNHNHLSG